MWDPNEVLEEGYGHRLGVGGLGRGPPRPPRAPPRPRLEVQLSLCQPRLDVHTRPRGHHGGSIELP